VLSRTRPVFIAAVPMAAKQPAVIIRLSCNQARVKPASSPIA